MEELNNQIVTLAFTVLVMAVTLPAFAHIFGRAASAWVLHQELALLKAVGRGALWLVRQAVGGLLQLTGHGVGTVGRKIRGVPPPAHHGGGRNRRQHNGGEHGGHT